MAAILHSEYPVRYWDADLGPAQPRLFAVEPGRRAGIRQARHRGQRRARHAAQPDPSTLGSRLRDAISVVSPDGKTLYTSLMKPLPKADLRSVLAAVDVATGTLKVLLDEEGMNYFPGPVSPDGGMLAVVSESDTTPQQAPQVKLHLLDVSGEAGPEDLQPLAHGWDRWPHPEAWLPDGSALLVTADDDGASPVFSVTVAAGAAPGGVSPG